MPYFTVIENKKHALFGDPISKRGKKRCRESFLTGLRVGRCALPFLCDAVGEEEFQECLVEYVAFVG